MTISSLAVAGENAGMDSTHPRSDGPQRRRTFSPAEKLAHLAALSWDVVPVDKPDDVNVVIGQAHFIKTVEDLA